MTATHDPRSALSPLAAAGSSASSSRLTPSAAPPAPGNAARGLPWPGGHGRGAAASGAVPRGLAVLAGRGVRVPRPAAYTRRAAVSIAIPGSGPGPGPR